MISCYHKKVDLFTSDGKIGHSYSERGSHDDFDDDEDEHEWGGRRRCKTVINVDPNNSYVCMFISK